MSEQQPNLTAVLGNLIARSESDRGSVKTWTLTRGLFVSVQSTAAKFTLRTWRINQLPDMQEWYTVFDYLPDGYKIATRPEPVPVTEDKQTVLSASWTVLKLF